MYVERLSVDEGMLLIFLVADEFRKSSVAVIS
jgi:hypothetical protein